VDYETEEMTWEVRLAGCQQAIGVQFEDLDILRRCLTHSSTARTRLESNERLEFFGDAVLGLVVCDYLFRTFPECSEGEMTRIKSAVVSRTACAEVCLELGLEQYLKLGKGLVRGIGSARTIPTSILAAAFEALIAAVVPRSYSRYSDIKALPRVMKPLGHSSRAIASARRSCSSFLYECRK
jgi:ribonuclease-3